MLAGSQADDQISFNRDVKAILSDNCFTCHGPDEDQRLGGFRLDVRDSAIVEADSGETPIVPGKADLSEILVRIQSDDDDLRRQDELARLRLRTGELSRTLFGFPTYPGKQP